MVLCFVCCVASTVISFKFRNTALAEEKVKSTSFKEYRECLNVPGLTDLYHHALPEIRKDI